MKIAVIGAGAMGSLYGALLSDKHEVWLVDIWEEHIQTVQKLGLRITSQGKEWISHPKACTSAEEAGNCDLLIVFVKAGDTEKALSQARTLLKEHTLVLTLQNGYGNVEKIQRFVSKAQIVRGITTAGAVMQGPGNVFWSGDGPVYLGPVDGSDQGMVNMVARAFKDCGINAVVSDRIGEMIWEKLLVNIGLNAVLALLEMRNEFMAQSPEAYALALNLIEEGVKVAKAEGYQLDGNKIAEQYYIEGAARVGKNFCSMLQDVKKKRKTEIEALNGTIVKLGKQYGIETPYNQTLYLLMKAKEETYR